MLLIILLAGLLQQPSFYFTMLEASRQEIRNDKEDFLQGIEYEIKLIANKNASKLRFVSITVEQRGCDFQIHNISRPNAGSYFHKGDTLLIKALLKNPNAQPGTREKPYPVIGYTCNKVLYYFPIRQAPPEMKKKEKPDSLHYKP
jgi:hypothetical protein